MTFFNPITSAYKKLAFKVHKYIACCASCGELREPLQGRLCTSLQPDFAVDALFVAETHDFSPQQAHALQKNVSEMPWVKNVFVIIPANNEEKTTRNNPAFTSSNSPQVIFSRLSHIAYASTLDELSEFFIVLPSLKTPQSRTPLDFFTPNGIPLLAAFCQPRLLQDEAPFSQLMQQHGLHNEQHTHFLSPVRAFTKTLVAEFLTFHEKAPTLSEQDYFTAFARWTYATGRAIPVGAEKTMDQ